MPGYEKTKEGPNLLIVHHTLPHKLHTRTSASQEELLGLKPFSACRMSLGSANPWDTKKIKDAEYPPSHATHGDFNE